MNFNIDNLLNKVLGGQPQQQQQQQQYQQYPGQQQYQPQPQYQQPAFLQQNQGYPGQMVQQQPPPPQPQAQGQVVLPPGWVSQWSAQYNTPFYVNTATGQTQWTPPVPQQPQYQPQPQYQQQQPQYQQQQVMQPQQAPVLPAGKRKALYIGINYVGTKNALRGCHEDVKNVKAFMDSQAQWESTVLVDTPQNQSTPYYPTRQNILNAMHWLVASAQPGDRLFFHYSGHGGQKADQDGDEADGFDETIYPVDHERAGMIIDDEMHRIMCQSLPQGAYLFVIFDCCHSGTILDLPFTYVLDKNDQVVEVDNRKEAGKALLQAAMSFARNDKMGALQSAMTAGKFIMNEINNPGGQNQQQQQQIQGEGLRTNGNKITRGTIVSLTGCRDDQTSADAFIQGRNTGAMSWAFMEAVRRLPQPTYVQLLREIRVLLYGKYEQVPQLSAGFHMDLNTRFIL